MTTADDSGMMRLQVSVPPETLARLDRYAQEYGYTRSQAGRQLIADALALVLDGEAADVQTELARSAA
jgi:hypothetical protein